MSERAESAGVHAYVSLETLPLSDHDSLNNGSSESISHDDQSNIISVNHVPQSVVLMPSTTS